MKEEKHMLSILQNRFLVHLLSLLKKQKRFLHEKSDPKAKEKILKRAKKTRGTDEENAENNPVREPNSNQ